MPMLPSRVQASRATTLPVEVQFGCDGAETPSATALRRWAELALEGQAGAVCVRIVDAAESAELNRRFRAKPVAANVLSFPVHGVHPGERSLLGDVAVCAPVVAAEAQAQGKRVADHFAHMVIHGVLHLRGFDHQTATDAHRMEAAEVELLGRLGLGNPYVS